MGGLPCSLAPGAPGVSGAQEQLAPTSGIGGGGVDGHMLPGLAASAVARALREEHCEAPCGPPELGFEPKNGELRQQTWGFHQEEIG